MNKNKQHENNFLSKLKSLDLRQASSRHFRHMRSLNVFSFPKKSLTLRTVRHLPVLMKDVDLNLQKAGGVVRFETGTTEVLLMACTAAWSFQLAAWPPGPYYAIAVVL